MKKSSHCFISSGSWLLITLLNASSLYENTTISLGKLLATVALMAMSIGLVVWNIRLGVKELIKEEKAADEVAKQAEVTHDC